MNEEGLLEEALEAIDGICLLNEAPGFEHIATGAPRKKESPKPAPKPQVSRKEKVKAAVKSAASTAGRAVGTAAGKAVNTGEKVGSAVKSAAKGAGKTVKKVARGAGEVAGSAAGGFAAGYKAARNAKYDTKKDTGAKQRPSKPSTWGNKSSDNKSPVSDKGVASRKSNKPNTYDKVKSGLKKAIGAGARAVFIKTDGTLWAWGDNEYGALGLNGSANAHQSSPTQIPGTTWDSINESNSTVRAIKTDGTLWAWGRNNYGQVGQNNRTDYSSPVQVGSATDWVSGGQGNFQRRNA